MRIGFTSGNSVLLCLMVALCSAVGPPIIKGTFQAKQITKVGQAKKRFTCPVEADPLPIIQWFKDGEPISEIWPRYHITQEGILRITDIEHDDAGKFQCKATNGFGSVSIEYLLIVVNTNSTVGNAKHDAIAFEQSANDELKPGEAKLMNKAVLIGPHPKNESVVLGRLAYFQCKVKSTVRPHIQWLKRIDKDKEFLGHNSSVIEVKGQKFLVLKTGPLWKDKEGLYLNKLVIKNVIPADVGMYICLGANPMGYSFRSAYLTLLTSDGQGKTSSSSGKTISPSLSGRSSGTHVGNGSLLLIIAIPAGVAIVLVTLAIVIFKRCKQCNVHSNIRRNTRFNAVPTQENFKPAMHINPHIISQKASGQSSSSQSTRTHSIDVYSAISSVSRYQHHQNQNHHNAY